MSYAPRCHCGRTIADYMGRPWRLKCGKCNCWLHDDDAGGEVTRDCKFAATAGRPG